jgi:hypothetical protein
MYGGRWTGMRFGWPSGVDMRALLGRQAGQRIEGSVQQWDHGLGLLLCLLVPGLVLVDGEHDSQSLRYQLSGHPVGRL